MNMTSELVVLILSVFTFGAALWNGWRHRDWVLLAWVVAFSLTIVYYGLLVFHYPGFAEDTAARQAIIRPAQAFSLLLLTLHFGNGAINRFISRILALWKSPSKV